jgi:hypothetical protein
MAMFGNKRQAFGAIPGMGQMQPPMAQPQPQVGAMTPNTQAMTKKPGFFAPGQTGRHIVGFIGDALQQMSGGQPTYMPQMMQMKQQDAEIRARLQAALEKRKADREDFVFEQDYQRANPKPVNNDTTADYDYIASKLGKEAADNYLRLKTERPQTTIIDNGDGTKTIYQLPSNGMAPTAAPQRPVGKLRPIGGQPGGTGPFVQ